MTDHRSEVCHVGFTRVEDDHHRIVKVWSFLESLGHSTKHWRLKEHDKLDLNTGRDFLAEGFEYDVVILHFLWRPSTAARGDHLSLPDFKSSPLHSWSQWRKRLLQTKARYIFPFGGCTEINGSFISLLPGYNLYGPMNPSALSTARFDIDQDFWCYARSDAKQPKQMPDLRFYQPLTQEINDLPVHM